MDKKDLTELQETALKYHELSLQTFPLPKGKKIPFRGHSWKDQKPQTTLSIYQQFEKDSNIAIIGGAVSDNFYVLDFDSMGLFNQHRIKLEYVLNNSAVVRTGRGVQVYLKANFPVATSKPLKGLDIKGQGGYVVAPPSLHPNGKQYTFWDELGDILIINPDELPLNLNKTVYNALQAAPQRIITDGLREIYSDIKPYGLSYRLFQILKADPEIIKKYDSRSEAEMAVVTYCVNNSWTFDEIKALFYMHSRPGTKFKDQKAHNSITADKWLFSMYSGAKEYLKENRRKIDELISQYQRSAHFSGRTAIIDSAVYSSILTIAKRSGKLTIGASCREIAELAGIHSRTASSSIHRIPFIEIKDFNEMKAKNIKLVNPQKVTNLHNPLHSLMYRDLKNFNADLWTFRGLSKNGYLIFQELSDIPKSLKTISLNTGINMRTVIRKIKILAAVNGCYKTKGGYIKNNDFDINKAAVQLGVSGVLEKRKKQHRQDRAIYKAYKESKINT